MSDKPQQDYQVLMAIGRLTRDIEPRVTPTGKLVLNFSLAQTQPDGSSLFLDCEHWPAQAGSDAEKRRKGDKVLIEGRLILAVWDDKVTSERKSKIKVRARSVQLLAEPKNRTPDENPHEPPRSFGVQPPRPRPTPPPQDNIDEDVPF